MDDKMTHLIDNEMTHLIYCSHFIRHGGNATARTGLTLARTPCIVISDGATIDKPLIFYLLRIARYNVYLLTRNIRVLNTVDLSRIILFTSPFMLIIG